MPEVFLNGRFVELDGAKVSASDAGLLHAVGLFETMLAGRHAADAAPTNGTPDGLFVHRLEDHLDRLITSARELGLSDSLRKPALAEAVVETLRRAGICRDPGSRARIRLTITGGDLNYLAAARAAQADPQPDPTANPPSDPPAPGRSAHDPTILITAQPATAYPDAMFEQGVRIVLGDPRLNPLDPFQGHKTLNYWLRLRTLQQAAARQAAEALLFQVTNHLAGGCVSNAMLIKDGTLLTPIARGEEQDVAAESASQVDNPQPTDQSTGQPTQQSAAQQPGAIMPSPVLPGVTRAAIIELARRHGIDTHRRMLTIADVLAADELFLTNSSWGVLPVVAVEGERIGQGHVGELTRTLRTAWLEGVERGE